MEKAHGIMFHHFHDGQNHIVGQGSISAEQFDEMLNFYGKKYNIISAEEFFKKSQNDTLSEKDVCLTFDDGLLCQFDIAYPIMRERGLTAFWFIYTSPMEGVLEKLEIYRHFRFSVFSDIEEFYSVFFDIARCTQEDVSEKLRIFKPDEYAKECPFYTPNDKRFRYLRDFVLEGGGYDKIMGEMISKYHYDIQAHAKLLWMDAFQIKELHNNGHVIGLHSYSHPTTMSRKNLNEQSIEYEMNKNQLEEIIADRVVAVSYPCNSYNDDTIKCMEDLGIKIGFRANMGAFHAQNKKLEYPREDHANIIREMEEGK